jgi:hypothetical protein
MAREPHLGAENPFSRHRVSPYIFVCTTEAIGSNGQIGKTSMLNDVYNAKILDLAGNIPRLGRLEAPDASATAHSKLCGSTVTVDLKMNGPVVGDFAHDV